MGTLIIGIGNHYRGDDALGCLIAAALKQQRYTNTEIIEHDGEPASLIDLWHERSNVILIDAVSSGAEVGTIHRIDLRKHALPNQFRCYSTHAFGIAEAVELARTLNKLPPKIIFYGVEGKSFSADMNLSSLLQEAAEILRLQISDEINEKNNT